MSFYDDVAARLVAQGVGVLNTNIFVSSKEIVPDGLGPYLSVIETGGTGPMRTHTTKTQRPSASIVTRAEKHQVVRAMAKAAYDALDGVFNTTINGTFYQSITARQEPMDIGLDGKVRIMIVFTIDAQKNPS